MNIIDFLLQYVICPAIMITLFYGCVRMDMAAFVEYSECAKKCNPMKSDLRGVSCYCQKKIIEPTGGENG